MAFKVSVSNITDKNEWKCTGQTLTMTLPLTDTVRFPVYVLPLIGGGVAVLIIGKSKSSFTAVLRVTNDHVCSVFLFFPPSLTVRETFILFSKKLVTSKDNIQI